MREMYPYEGTPSTSWDAGKPAAVHVRSAASALALPCVELLHASPRGALGPGVSEAADRTHKVERAQFRRRCGSGSEGAKEGEG